MGAIAAARCGQEGVTGRSAHPCTRDVIPQEPFVSTRVSRNPLEGWEEKKGLLVME